MLIFCKFACERFGVFGFGGGFGVLLFCGVWCLIGCLWRMGGLSGWCVWCFGFPLSFNFLRVWFA